MVQQIIILHYHKSARSFASHLLPFRNTTFHWALTLSASLRPKYGTPYLFTSNNPKPTLPSDVIVRRTTFTQPILFLLSPCPLAAPVMCPDSLLRLWGYINPLPTRLLTCKSIVLFVLTVLCGERERVNGDLLLYCECLLLGAGTWRRNMALRRTRNKGFVLC